MPRKRNKQKALDIKQTPKGKKDRIRDVGNLQKKTKKKTVLHKAEKKLTMLFN